jgi:WD40 repeat protein
VTVWEVSQGKLLKVLRLPADFSESRAANLIELEFSPDRRYLAAAFKDHEDGAPSMEKRIVVWDLPSGAVRTVLKALDARGTGISFSATGQWLAYYSQERKITLWNLALERQDRDVGLPFPAASTVVFSPGDRHLAAVCQDPARVKKTCIVWDLSKHQEALRRETRGDPFLDARTALAFHPSGNRLALSHNDPIGDLSVIDLAGDKEDLRLPAVHKLMVMHMVWHADGRHLTTVGGEGAVKVWKLADDDLHATRALDPKVGAHFVAFSPDRRWTVMPAQEKESLCLIDRATGKTIQELEGYRDVLFRPDSQQLAVLTHGGEKSDEPIVYEVSTGKVIARLGTNGGRQERMSSLAFDPAGELLVTRSSQGEDPLDPRKIMRTLAINRMAAVGNVISSATLKFQGNRKLSVWNVNAQRQVWTAPTDGSVADAWLSPDGRLVIGTPRDFGPNRFLTLWELPSGRKLAQVPLDPNVILANLVVSPDSRWLAVSAMRVGKTGRAEKEETDLQTTLLALPSLQKRWELSTGLVQEAGTFSLDSRLLALRTLDGSIAVWHAERGEELFRWKASVLPVECLAFTPEGTIVCSDMPARHLHELNLNELRRQLAELGLDW